MFVDQVGFVTAGVSPSSRMVSPSESSSILEAAGGMASGTPLDQSDASWSTHPFAKSALQSTAPGNLPAAFKEAITVLAEFLRRRDFVRYASLSCLFGPQQHRRACL